MWQEIELLIRYIGKEITECGGIQMKRMFLMALTLCLLCVGALADGSGDWLYSSMNGWVQLASYTGEYDGYVCVDGLGGVTGADAYTVTVISKSASVWEEPRTNSKKLASAQHGESLMCLSSDGGESLEYENGFYAVGYHSVQGEFMTLLGDPRTIVHGPLENP